MRMGWIWMGRGCRVAYAGFLVFLVFTFVFGLAS